MAGFGRGACWLIGIYVPARQRWHLLLEHWRSALGMRDLWLLYCYYHRICLPGVHTFPWWFMLCHTNFPVKAAYGFLYILQCISNNLFFFFNQLPLICSFPFYFLYTFLTVICFLKEKGHFSFHTHLTKTNVYKSHQIMNTSLKYICVCWITFS